MSQSNPFPPSADQKRWDALLRGQVLSATINKFSVILRLIDQKAQVMILLNSFMIPLCIRSMETPKLHDAAIMSIFAGVLSILAAIVCIYPKRKYRKNGHRDLNLLHFNDIGHMDKEDYLNQILPKFNDPSQLAELAVYDLYDVSRYSIMPKFLWLKISYSLFAFGNLAAIALAVFEITQKS